MRKRTIGFFAGILLGPALFAQPAIYTTANAHSHNDYQNPRPFYTAYEAGLGSLEADIFLYHDSLLVGHTMDDLKIGRSLQHLYLDPLLQAVQRNKGYPYSDSTRKLQMLIDCKTEPLQTLHKLMELLKNYPLLISSPGLQWVMTGNRPSPDSFAAYPGYIWFDGELNKKYTAEALKKIALISGDFRNYSTWNGKGNLSDENQVYLDSLIQAVHGMKKKIRFWNAPDFINAWYQFMKLKVDFINTDHINEIANFLSTLSATSYTSPETYAVYEPTYRSDGARRPVKNIILLIGDGTALPQLYAGYTANHGALNIFKMKNTGISKTSSNDNYITDSAPGSTAIASGVKTNNHYVGVDPAGTALKLLPAYLQRRKIKTGLVTCGDITDATPADFYAHQKDRENSRAIIRDLKGAPVSILMGSGNESLERIKLFKDDNRKPFNDTITRELEPEYTVVNSVDQVPANTVGKWIVVDPQAGLSMLNGRGDWLMKAFSKTVNILSHNKEGFFLMTEGAQIDYGGHENNISYVATEVADFDRVVGKALAFADSNGETLVIVTADHETGGLTLLEGDYSKGFVSGRFSTSDHTALPVSVFAYGPGSDRFRGVYENTALFKKILDSFGIYKP